MSNLLYTIAVILIICWAIGFFAYSAGAIIHLLLVLALVAILLRVIQGKKTSRLNRFIVVSPGAEVPGVFSFYDMDRYIGMEQLQLEK